MPRRFIFVSLLLLALAASLVLALLVTSTAGSAPSGMACNAGRKARNVPALASFMKTAPARRAAFFRTHRKPGERAAFVKRQRARLAVLRKAAASSARACPTSSGLGRPPCSPLLARSPRTDPVGFPSTYTEVATDYSIFLRPLGEIRGVMVFVDFSDTPGTESTNTLYDQIVPYWAKWYADVSHGRISMNITPGPEVVQDAKDLIRVLAGCLPLRPVLHERRDRCRRCPGRLQQVPDRLRRSYGDGQHLPWAVSVQCPRRRDKEPGRRDASRNLRRTGHPSAVGLHPRDAPPPRPTGSTISKAMPFAMSGPGTSWPTADTSRKSSRGTSGSWAGSIPPRSAASRAKGDWRNDLPLRDYGQGANGHGSDWPLNGLCR